MRIKICGITNIEDALQAINAGADALGFVFYQKSPRYISPQNAAKIIKELPPFIEKVALFVNENADTINSYMQISRATLAQLHFEAEDSVIEELEYPYIRVIRAKNAEDIRRYENEYRLVDAFTQEYGGAGKRVELEWFKGVNLSKIILAGGLNYENLESIKNMPFYALDVSSGVEGSRAKKSHKKVTDFIKKAKIANG